MSPAMKEQSPMLKTIRKLCVAALGVLMAGGVAEGQSTQSGGGGTTNVTDNGVINAVNAAAITPPLPVVQQSQTFSDVSQYVSANGNSGILTRAGASMSASISVSNISGGEYSSVEIDTCPDGTATSCTKVWGGNYYASTLSFAIPPIQVQGPYRWLWTVGGSGSLLLNISSTHTSASVPPWYAIFANAFSSSSMGSVSGALPAVGCSNYTTAITLGSGSAPVIQTQVSLDGVSNWTNIGSTVTPTAATTTFYNSPTGGTLFPYLRYQVTTTGTASNSNLYWYCR